MRPAHIRKTDGFAPWLPTTSAPIAAVAAHGPGGPSPARPTGPSGQPAARHAEPTHAGECGVCWRPGLGERACTQAALYRARLCYGERYMPAGHVRLCRLCERSDMCPQGICGFAAYASAASNARRAMCAKPCRLLRRRLAHGAAPSLT